MTSIGTIPKYFMENGNHGDNDEEEEEDKSSIDEGLPEAKEHLALKRNSDMDLDDNNHESETLEKETLLPIINVIPPT